MKVLFIAAVMVLCWHSPTAAVYATPAAPPGPIAALAPAAAAPDGIEDCLQRCLDEFRDNIRQCKEACRVCTFALFGLCLASKVDEDCFLYCKSHAKEVHKACKQECIEA